MQKKYDFILVGGGLANGLLAARLKQLKPNISILLLEKGDVFGGNHTWSFFENDLTTDQLKWVGPFITKRWLGTDVFFPDFSKGLTSPYCSVSSDHFNSVLQKINSLSEGLNQQVEDVFPDRVLLTNGQIILGDCVIDGRGWVDQQDIPVAYQKFVGLDVKLKNSHGLHQPIIMDATCSQIDGFRFFYVLPWDVQHCLIEDTHYSDNREIDTDVYEAEIKNYAKTKGWEIEKVIRKEQGALVIPLGGNRPLFQPSLVTAGTKAGLFHATTGYSFASAVQWVDFLCQTGTLNHAALFATAGKWADSHWRSQAFFRRLNRMMFYASQPETRYKIFQQFYSRPEKLIQRFYRGKLSPLDKIRILSGRPPVSLRKAAQHFFELRG